MGFQAFPWPRTARIGADEGVDTPEGRDLAFGVFGDIMNIACLQCNRASVDTLHDPGYGVDYSMAHEWEAWPQVTGPGERWEPLTGPGCSAGPSHRPG